MNIFIQENTRIYFAKRMKGNTKPLYNRFTSLDDKYFQTFLQYRKNLIQIALLTEVVLRNLPHAKL